MLVQDTVLQGRYRVIRQLGQGGMGAVYEAMDERLDTTVALKETLFAEERLRKQFEREARLLARMHHPALPRVSDHFSEGEGQFLVMQYIAGEDLAKMMQDKQGPFPPDQVLTWGDQLLDALDYLHTQDPQIIHRDIKPQNLKLTSRGQIILLDFGLAKGQSGGVSVVTTSASIYGYTPNYAPLEQIQGLGTDARSDIYALSATLYHLMTAVKPPDALTRAAALVNGQSDPLVPANQISSFIGPEVASVLTRAMSQNRDQRYPTAAGMRAALKGTGEVATLAGKAEAATMILEPSAATLHSTSPPSSTSSASQPASRTGETTVVQSASGKRSWAPLAIAAAVLLMVGVVFGGYFAFTRVRNSTVETPTVNSNQENSNSGAPATADTSTEPGSGTVNDDTQVDTPIQRAETVLKKNESSTKQEDNTAKTTKQTQAPAAPKVPEPVQQDAPEEAFVPLIDSNNTGLLDRRRRLGGPAIRNLPDGSRIVVNPDGTRVLISPNGARRVLRPGQRLNRRNATPYP